MDKPFGFYYYEKLLKEIEEDVMRPRPVDTKYIKNRLHSALSYHPEFFKQVLSIFRKCTRDTPNKIAEIMINHVKNSRYYNIKEIIEVYPLSVLDLPVRYKTVELFLEAFSKGSYRTELLNNIGKYFVGLCQNEIDTLKIELIVMYADSMKYFDVTPELCKTALSLIAERGGVVNGEFIRYVKFPITIELFLHIIKFDATAIKLITKSMLKKFENDGSINGSVKRLRNICLHSVQINKDAFKFMDAQLLDMDIFITGLSDELEDMDKLYEKLSSFDDIKLVEKCIEYAEEYMAKPPIKNAKNIG